ncbi:hypothetical protein ADUPG1_009562 [Aduncisulcus paluster]|uniref:ELYS-like domain-containing protein n=1 Tax=Aduncisulcus paluster TaxID=2918883 RepID=A0ABQ5KW32_9EUKA|nr:hypothetical protein ADUPG1_009562 [Aduncisulcus paluster]
MQRLANYRTKIKNSILACESKLTIPLFDEALHDIPEWSSLWIDAASFAGEQSNFPLKEAYLRNGILVCPSCDLLFFLLAEHLFQMDRKEEAENVFKDLCKIRGNKPSPLIIIEYLKLIAMIDSDRIGPFVNYVRTEFPSSCTWDFDIALAGVQAYLLSHRVLNIIELRESYGKKAHPIVDIIHGIYHTDRHSLSKEELSKLVSYDITLGKILPRDQWRKTVDSAFSAHKKNPEFIQRAINTLYLGGTERSILGDVSCGTHLKSQYELDKSVEIKALNPEEQIKELCSSSIPDLSLSVSPQDSLSFSHVHPSLRHLVTHTFSTLLPIPASNLPQYFLNGTEDLVDHSSEGKEISKPTPDSSSTPTFSSFEKLPFASTCFTHNPELLATAMNCEPVVFLSGSSSPKSRSTQSTSKPCPHQTAIKVEVTVSPIIPPSSLSSSHSIPAISMDQSLASFIVARVGKDEYQDIPRQKRSFVVARDKAKKVASFGSIKKEKISELLSQSSYPPATPPSVIQFHVKLKEYSSNFHHMLRTHFSTYGSHQFSGISVDNVMDLLLMEPIPTRTSDVSTPLRLLSRDSEDVLATVIPNVSLDIPVEAKIESMRSYTVSDPRVAGGKRRSRRGGRKKGSK